jgi:hypothetical protein
MKYPIADNQTIKAIKGKFGEAENFYDDSFGDIYICRSSIRTYGFIRCRSEDAYSIWEDEFASEANETIEEIKKEYDFKIEHIKIIHPAFENDVFTNEKDRFWIDYSQTKEAEISDYSLTGGKLLKGQFVEWQARKTPLDDSFADNPIFQENYGFRPNGRNKNDKIGHGIYSKDINGDYIDLLTIELAKDLELTIELETEE